MGPPLHHGGGLVPFHSHEPRRNPPVRTTTATVVITVVVCLGLILGHALDGSRWVVFPATGVALLAALLVGDHIAHGRRRRPR
jgi:hypothetical protein